MNDKKPEIIYIKLDQAAAAWNPEHDYIMIDPRLNKYPSLKKLIIQHELGHRNKDKNVFDCVVRDISDYARMRLHPDFKSFMKDKKTKQTFWQGMGVRCQMFAYFLASLFITLPVTSMITTIVKSWRWINAKI